MTHRSEPRPDCAYCKGSGIVSVSKDPDDISDCVCTRPPERIRLSRRKGWRKPENTVVVARPSKWGNPYKVGDCDNPWYPDERNTRADAVDFFRMELVLMEGIWWDAGDRYLTPEDVRAELAGKNLACWCPLDQPCHADVLLELANGGPRV